MTDKPDKKRPDELETRTAEHDSEATEQTRLETVEQTAAPSRSDTLPPSIGRYRVLAKLGEGGMGVVYEAQQQNPRRRVAVKVVRGGAFVDDARVRMFQREADTLARLKHPNIGAIHESGRTADGQHFFAMELVRGDTLGEYLAGRPPLDSDAELRFRLALFRKIADAVNYAHQRGVIHRDLKPTNIVVTEEGSREESTLSSAGTSTSRLPEIKILDFGLARITEGDVAAATMTTEVGVIKGTLPYMSPEQARGNPQEIDLRTDVYALGVILYEMLTGRRPYDVLKRSLADAVRVICEEPPSSVAAALPRFRRLDSDVETIVGKALEKDPERRYASAAALSDDIARYLASQPILARPPSTMYQLRKFARRNRALVGGVAAVFVVLLGASIVATVLYLQAETARAQAARERDAAQAVTDHLTGMLTAIDPRKAQGREITVREVLDESSKTIGTAFPDQPLVEAAVRLALASTYQGLSGPEAEEHFRAAVALRTDVLGPEHPDTLEAVHALSSLFFFSGRLDEAEASQRSVLEIRRRVLGPEHEDTLWTMHDLAATLRDQGETEEAERLARELVPVVERTLGADHSLTIWAKYTLATIVDRLGKREEAESLFLDVVERRLRLLGDRHMDTLWAMTLLSYVQSKLGKQEEAEARLRKVIDIQTEILGPDHFDTLWSSNILGEVLLRQGRLDESRALLQRVLDERLELLGEESRDTLWTMSYLAFTYRNAGRLDEAEALTRRALEIRRRHLGETHWDTLWSKEDLAELLRRKGEPVEAENLVRDVLAVRKERLPQDLPDYRDNLWQLGKVLLAQKRFAESEEALLEAVELLDENPGTRGYRDDEIVPGLVELYETWAVAEPAADHPQQAERWRTRLRVGED